MALVGRFAKVVASRSLGCGSQAFRSRAAVHKLCFAQFATKYTPQHEYVQVDGKTGKFGITDFAQNQLGDVVYVDLPAVGDALTKGETFGAVESVKAASDVYAPVSGTVTAINEDLADQPHLVNEEAMGKGWFVKVELQDESELDDLLDEDAYKEHCENEEH